MQTTHGRIHKIIEVINTSEGNYILRVEKTVLNLVLGNFLA